MPWRRNATIAIAICLLLGLCTSAHALGVEVKAPGTAVSIQPDGSVSVTAPGTQVNAGPGGTSVTVAPGQALGALTGQAPPGLPVPPAGGAGAPPAGQAAAASPSSPGLSSPAAGGSPSRAAAPAADASPGAARGSARTSSTRAAAGRTGAPRGGASATPRAAATGDRPAARRERATGRGRRTSVVDRIVERVPGELLAALAATALLAAAMSLVWLRERSRVRVAKREAQVDPLTGIANRLAFQRRLAHEWKRARRYGRPLGVLMLDLDGLKQVNDRDGHEAGDRMISTAAERIAGDIRESDLVARLAGDEFVVLCPETQRRGLQQLATKLDHQLDQGGIRASIGWAELRDGDLRPEDLVARADEEMYRAKESRRAGGEPRVPQGFAIAS